MDQSSDSGALQRRDGTQDPRNWKVKLTPFPVAQVTKEDPGYLHCWWLEKLEHLVALDSVEETAGNRSEGEGRAS